MRVAQPMVRCFSSMHSVQKFRAHGGYLERMKHRSSVCGCDMTLAVYTPEATGSKPPVVYWLSGLTCTDENFSQKAAAFETANKLGIALVMPDTSPRGDHVPDEDPKTYDFGKGAGFYLNATTEKYKANYNMLDYITKELPAVLAESIDSIDWSKAAIMGHSMGGHGAMTIAFKSPGKYASVSAFSPICNPTTVPWGEKAFKLYLGEDKEAWKQYDTVELIKSYSGPPLRLLVEQGTADNFLGNQLKPEALRAACDDKGIALNLRMREGYDHSYYFMSSFMADHLKFHASYLTGKLQWCPEPGDVPNPGAYSSTTLAENLSTVGKEIECAAAVAFAPKKPLQHVKVKVAPPQKGEVRIRSVAVALCHTDTYTLECSDPEDAFPCILGHQAAGIVESVGEGVTEFKPGDHVIPFRTDISVSTSARSATSAGAMSDFQTRYTYEGKPINHFLGASSFSEYSVLQAGSLAKVRQDAPLEKCCVLGGGVSTGWGAVWNTAQVERGETAAVFGIGAVGLSVIEALVKSGASRIVAVDLLDSRLELGKKWGATDTVNPKSLPEGKNVVQALTSLIDVGVDYTFDCSGSTAVMRDALEVSSRGWGTSVVVGVVADGQEISTKPLQLVTGRSWKGTAFGGWKSKQQAPVLVDLYMSGELKIDEYITHEMDFKDINKAFELLRHGEGLCCVLKF